MANWFELAKTYPLKPFLEEAYGLEFRKSACLCPFHADRNPSMHVVEKKEPHYYHCVVCGAGGDIVKFVEKMDNISPTDAAKKVLLHYGVDVGKPMTKEEEAKAEEEQRARIELLQKDSARKEKAHQRKKAKVIEEMTTQSEVLSNALYEAFENNNEPIIDEVEARFPKIYNNTEIRDLYMGWDYDHESLCLINRQIKSGKTYNIKYYREKDKKGTYKPGKWISRYDSTTEVFGLDFLQDEGPVFVCEGEKDVINLLLLGCNALTLGGVSNSWEPYSAVLKDRDVIVWYDNDKAGYVNAIVRAKELEPIARTCVLVLFYKLGHFSSKYDVSDYLADKRVDTKKELMDNISYSSFSVSNVVIDEIIQNHEWSAKEGWQKKKLESLKVEDKITSFYDNIPTIVKHIAPIHGEKDYLLKDLDAISKELLQSTHLDNLSKFVNSLFLEDQKVFFEEVKTFKAFIKTKKEILKEFRQVHIFDMYDGIYKCVHKAGFDFWKFRDKLYFWTGSYFCIVLPWELDDFVFNVFFWNAGIEKKKRTNRNKIEVIENIFSKATPMERYIDDTSRVVNLKNGVLIIRRSGKITFRNHHKKTDCATNMLNFKYDPKATCRKWDKFLKRVLPEENDRLMLEEFMGYCLLPTHEYEHFLYMHGSTGSNGKSVILKIISNFFSDENVSSLDLSQFEGHEMHSLANKIVNIGAEVNSKKDLSAQLNVLKKLVSPYDTVQINPKFEKSFVLYPHEKPKCIFSANKELSYDADDGGVLRRILLLSFEQTIQGDEIIRDLPERIAEENSGILNRLLAGIERLVKQNGFTLSENRKSKMDEFKKNINPIRAYLLNNLVRTEGVVIPKQMVYLHYQEWCKMEGRKHAPSSVFWKEFAQVYPAEFKRPNVKAFSHDVWGSRPFFLVGFTLSLDEIDVVKNTGGDILVSENKFTEVGYCALSTY